jgi:tripartite ATP-independent transporter DctM subunit
MTFENLSPAEIAGGWVAISMFAATVFFILRGYPVAFTLAGTALIFALGGHIVNQLGIFDFSIFNVRLLRSLATRYFGIMDLAPLTAVPMFIFMGVMLERTQIAEALLETMGQLFGPLRAGVGISVVLVGALLAASTGILGATVVTMGLLSLPTMMRAGYDPKLATGVISASGSLGQIIPPSVVLIFMANLLQVAFADAQAAMGLVSRETVTVTDLFAGAFIPGFMLVGAYISWLIIMAIFRPSSCPALVTTPEERKGLGRRVLFSLVPPIALIIAVLGSILFGIATPSESASVGGIGAMLLAVLYGKFKLSVLREVSESTLKITTMVFVILMGASVFSLVFRGYRGDAMIEEILTQLPGGAAGAVISVMAVMFVLGFFLDAFEIMFIVLPIAGPVLLQMGLSPIWLGVMIGVNLQTSFLTPPFGFALFYLRGVTPASIPTSAIYKGIIPFVALQVVVMGLVAWAPASTTWLPTVVRDFQSGRLSTQSDSGAPPVPEVEAPAGNSVQPSRGLNDSDILLGR